MNYLKNILNILAALPRNVRALVAAILVGVTVSAASAQEATNPANGLDLTGPIGAFGGAMTNTITTNAPTLFGILALAVGFYFLWGRVRSLF